MVVKLPSPRGEGGGHAPPGEGSLLPTSPFQHENLECFIIVANRWRCPLTSPAAQFTEGRKDNFDIYLPTWLARHNKTIFGSLFLAGELVVLEFWLKG